MNSNASHWIEYLFAFALLLTWAVCGDLTAQEHLNSSPLQDDTNPESRYPIPSHCGKLVEKDPALADLVPACAYGLNSLRNMPDFVCKETIARFEQGREQDWKVQDIVTAEVTFRKGVGQQFADVAVDGKPIKKLVGPHTPYEVASRIFSFQSSGLFDATHFGVDAALAFDPKNRSRIKSLGDAVIDDTTYSTFSFFVPSGGKLESLRQDGDYDPEYDGLIWIDKKSRRLRRIVSHEKDSSQTYRNMESKYSTDYGMVTISDLGEYLLPINGESILCDGTHPCYRNRITFTDCRKFAARVRIIPSDPPNELRK